MSDFNSALKEQHQSIMKVFKALREAWDKQNRVECNESAVQLQKLIKDHHKTECEILFHKLFRNPQIQMGGPFCMYFFDFFMADRPFSKALRRINQLRPPNQKLKEITIPENLTPFFKENSMLSLPLEEHLSQEALLDEIQNALQAWESKDAKWISNALDDLSDILKMNIEKEETCLWAIAKNIAS